MFVHGHMCAYTEWDFQWAYVLEVCINRHIKPLNWHCRLTLHTQGSTQITSVDQYGRNYLATVNKGYLWYFPAGLPHSLQATSEGTEFLLVCRTLFLTLSIGDKLAKIFPDGNFNDDNTFLVSWAVSIRRPHLSSKYANSLPTGWRIYRKK